MSLFGAPDCDFLPYTFEHFLKFDSELRLVHSKIVRAKIPELTNTFGDSQKMSNLISALIQHKSNELVNQLG
jgi:hypothetical protein